MAFSFSREKYRAEFAENLGVNHKEPRGEAVRAHLGTTEVKPHTASPTDPTAAGCQQLAPSPGPKNSTGRRKPIIYTTQGSARKKERKKARRRNEPTRANGGKTSPAGAFPTPATT